MFILITGYALPYLRKASFENIHFKLLLGVSLAQLLGLAMVAKVSTGWEVHYLLPVSSLSGISLVLIVLCIRQVVIELKIESRWAVIVQKSRHLIYKFDSKWLLLVLIISFLYFARKNETISVFRWKSQERDDSLSVYLKTENEYKDYAKIYYLSSSSPAFALRLGSDPAYAITYDDSVKKENAEVFKRLYPNVYFYLIFNRKYYNWDSEVPFEEILARHGKKVIFQGPRFEELFSRFDSITRPQLKMPDLLLRDIFKGKGEGLQRDTIYEIAISAEKVSGAE